jgi:hypothetical protein
VSEESTISLELRARQQKQMLEELRMLRKHALVTQGIVLRLDGTVQGLVAEIRAEHSRYSRLDRRVREIEERG